MSEIEIRNLAESRNLPTGSDLISDSETYLTDVTDEELDNQIGGVTFGAANKPIWDYTVGNSAGWGVLNDYIITGFTAGPIGTGISVVN